MEEILTCENCILSKKINIPCLIPLEYAASSKMIYNFVICENKYGDHYKHLLHVDHYCDDHSLA
jgi:hypothetical protein